MRFDSAIILCASPPEHHNQDGYQHTKGVGRRDAESKHEKQAFPYEHELQVLFGHPDVFLAMFSMRLIAIFSLAIIQLLFIESDSLLFDLDFRG